MGHKGSGADVRPPLSGGARFALGVVLIVIFAYLGSGLSMVQAYATPSYLERMNNQGGYFAVLAVLIPWTSTLFYAALVASAVDLVRGSLRGDGPGTSIGVLALAIWIGSTWFVRSYPFNTWQSLTAASIYVFSGSIVCAMTVWSTLADMAASKLSAAAE